jgi:hypothetical protein
MEAYTALVSTETSCMSQFYPGTIHDMQVRYYNCGKNRKKQNSSGCSDLGDLISPAGLFLLPKLTISFKWH